MRYAGFWRRFFAAALDGLLMQAGTLMFLLPLQSIDAVSQSEFNFLYFICVIIFTWVYYSLMESSSLQATLGKMTFGIKVTDMEGNQINFLKATGRHFLKNISALVLFIGFIMAAFTDKKQALHDIISGCLIVR